MPFGEMTESRRVQRPGSAAGPARSVRGDAARSVGRRSVERPGRRGVSYSIGPDFFPSLGLRLRARTRLHARPETFAGGCPSASSTRRWRRKLFGDDDPIGRQVQLNNRDARLVHRSSSRWSALAPPILHQMNDDDARPADLPSAGAGLPCRRSRSTCAPASASAEAEAAMLPAVRQALRQVDDRLPVVTLETRPMFRDRNLMLWVVRAGAWVFTAFGLVALAHGGARHLRRQGVPRVAAHARDRHPHGARREGRDVVRLVMSDGLALTVAGLAVGLGLSALISRAVGELALPGRRVRRTGRARGILQRCSPPRRWPAGCPHGARRGSRRHAPSASCSN